MAIREITPTRSFRKHSKALWRSRELMGFFIWRDWKVRYRQTLIGASWALIQPLVLVAIFATFLGQIVPSDQVAVPYPLFVFSGMVPWLLFAQGTGQAANSLVNHAELIRKAAFPRLVLPISAVGGFIPDFVVGIFVVAGWALVAGFLTAMSILTLLAGVLTLLCAVAVGTGLSALNVQYRDVRFATPFALQAWLFATPVVYPDSLLSETGRWLVALNPMTGPVVLFRWSVGASETISWAQVATSAGAALAILTVSVVYFLRTEDRMADVV